MRYLQAPNIYEQVVESSLLKYPKKRELAKAARDVFSQLFPNSSVPPTNAATNAEFRKQFRGLAKMKTHQSVKRCV